MKRGERAPIFLIEIARISVRDGFVVASVAVLIAAIALASFSILWE